MLIIDSVGPRRAAGAQRVCASDSLSQPASRPGAQRTQCILVTFKIRCCVQIQGHRVQRPTSRLDEKF